MGEKLFKVAKQQFSHLKVKKLPHRKTSNFIQEFLPQKNSFLPSRFGGHYSYDDSYLGKCMIFLWENRILLIRNFNFFSCGCQAERCLSDLDVPHFHHEIVYEAIQIALENNSDVIVEAIVGLLKHFFDCGMVSIDQMNSVSYFSFLYCRFLPFGQIFRLSHFLNLSFPGNGQIQL